MLAALRVVWFVLRALYADLFILIGASCLWFLLNLPFALLAGLAGWLLAVLVATGFGIELPNSLVVPLFVTLSLVGPSPAAGGLAALCARIAQEQLFEFAVVWQGLREHARRGLGLWAISIFGLVLILANAVFYWSSGQLVLQALGAIFTWGVLLWFAIQLLAMPLLVEQRGKGVFGVLRNAVVVTLAHPFFVVTLLVVALLGVALATVVAIVMPLVLGGFVGLIGARGVAELKWRYFPEEAPPPIDAGELEGA